MQNISFKETEIFGNSSPNFLLENISVFISDEIIILRLMALFGIRLLTVYF